MSGMCGTHENPIDLSWQRLMVSRVTWDPTFIRLQANVPVSSPCPQNFLITFTPVGSFLTWYIECAQ